MRTDLLKAANVDRSTTTTIQYQMVRGRINDLLFINTTTWHLKDKITIKLRHEGGLMTIVDRVPALVLALLCDMKQGMPTTGTPWGNDFGVGNTVDNSFVRYNQGVAFYENAFLLPLGHITLTGAQQLEINIECAQLPADRTKFPTGQVKVSVVERKSRADVLLCYDVSNDLEAQQNAIREIYLVAKDNVSFFRDGTGTQGFALPIAKDITVKLGVDGDDSENDIDGYGALTAITGQLTTQPNTLLRIFQDLESLPASVYIKVYGDDAEAASILYVREEQIPHMVGASISAAINKEQRRIEVLEQNEPDKARALQQTGQIATSERLAAAKDDFMPAIPAPVK
ncbi:MAG: hypothetical protein EOO37_00075 [Cytophagaceae bacterium]|nr:MAG: hypothetical protein EOO37_00075 [Cytophagaceae bacterium]